MSNTKTSRPLGNYGQLHETTRGTLSQCPHCGSPTQLYDRKADWDRARDAHRVPAGPLMLPPGSGVLAWWFCHHCDQGGAVLGAPNPLFNVR